VHEYVYADRILQSVLKQMSTSGKPGVKEVKVEVGEFLDLSNQSLNMAYGILSKETAAAGSKLRVKILRGSVRCPSCGYSGRIEPKKGEHAVDPVFACPKCGAPLKIESGNEVKIVSIV
jgi:hydrogenase nickel insertion protein HypA